MKKIFSYLPLIGLTVMVMSMIVAKYINTSDRSVQIFETAEVCGTYCGKFSDCARSEIKTLGKNQIEKLEVTCVRVCGKHFDKIATCTAPDKTDTCRDMAACLNNRIEEYKKKI